MYGFVTPSGWNRWQFDRRTTSDVVLKGCHMVGIRLELIGRCVLGLVLCSATLSACGAGETQGTAELDGGDKKQDGTTVQVSVAARDSPGDILHYRWAATEGTIKNVDAPSTTWIVPPGSGLQFAYVLVYDNKGGYTEFRAAGLTQAAVAQQLSATIKPPDDSGKGFIWGTLYYEGFGRQVYLSDWDVQVEGPDGIFTTTTDKKGEFFFPGLNLVSAPTYAFRYRVPGQISFTPGQSIPTSTLPTSPSSPTYSRQKVTLIGTLQIAGSVRMSDQSYCGIRDEFFTRSSTSNTLDGPISGTAELLDANDNTVGTPNPRLPATINHYGDYLIVLDQLTSAPVGPQVRIRCENLIEDRPVNLTALSGQQNGPSFTLANARPIVDKMTITLGGQNVGRPDLPAPVVLKRIPEMDLAPGDDAFLAFKGLDTRKGACAYYHKIGAVEECDNDGFPTLTGKQLTLDQWKKNFNLSPYHNDPAEPEYKAIYMNKFDLNFARDMQGLKRANGDLAYNVCNYPGPQNVNDPLGAPRTIGEETEDDINLSIENARRGIGMIVCVAMDYSVTSGLNGDQPFTKFYTFGPTGKLLLSVSLDGRREKFMPGSCTACHGGDNYGGKFPDDYSQTNPTGSGQANLGSYFLPFDLANFKFSTKIAELKRENLLPEFFKLNTLLQGTTGNPNAIPDDVSDLITRWYAGPLASPEHNSIAPPAYDPSIKVQLLPTPLNQQQSCEACHARTTTGYNAVSFYKEVVGPSCQICHSSNAIVPDSQAGELPRGELPRMTFFQRPPSHYLKPRGPRVGVTGPHTVCGGSTDLKMNHEMPNTLATFERFWLSKKPGKGPNQIDRLFSFSENGSTCGGDEPLPHPGL